MAVTKRLAALQLQRTDDLIRQWAQDDPKTFRDWGPRLDPLKEYYDPDLHRQVVRGTIEVIAGLLSRAGEMGIDLILLPEASLPTGQLMRPRTREAFLKMCAWSVGEYLDRIVSIARQHEMAIASCVYHAEGGKIYNAGILTDEAGSVAGVYHKVHLPCPAIVEPETLTEAGVLEAGSGYPVFECRAGKVGFMICYDIDFPESASCLALEGAEILLHPTVGYNFPDEEEGMGEARLRTRAVDTMRPLIHANFGLVPGCSCVINHSGTVAAKMGRESPAIVFADIAVGAPRGQDMFWPDYEHRSTILRKRRPDTYGVLVQPIPPALEGEHQEGERLYDYQPEVDLP